MRIVTPEQYRDGYLEIRGALIYQRQFEFVRKAADGNYVVRDPKLGRPLRAPN